MTSPLAIVPGISSITSISSPAHYLLSEGIERAEGPNIGVKGENLTISFLSMNRAHLSEKLCRSIEEHLPEFAGEVLVIDNGSSPETIADLSRMLARMRFRSRLIELGSNHGVAGGRNRTVEHVNTDWLMCLDNDIYFIANPLPRLQKEIGTTGAHFVSMPLMDPDQQKLFAFGGHLYLNSDDSGVVWLGAGSAYQQDRTGLLDEQVLLGTFLFGGSSILNVESFKRLGGYDEAMFIGFEDLDFSIRIFQAGMKVASSGLTALVHDHPPAQTKTDADYERTRFSRQIVERSAKHLQEKHGFSIWSNAVEEWLEARTKAIVGTQPEKGETTPTELVSASPRRMRVALVVDNDDWAFANIARQIERALGNRYQFDILPHTAFDNYFQLLAILEEYEFVHIFWREVLFAFDTPYNKFYAETIGCDLEQLIQRFFEGRPVTTAVYDHLFLSTADVNARLQTFNAVTGYTVSSNRLRNIYSALPNYPQPSLMFPDGVDLDLFKPSKLERFEHIHERPIVIGWVGNSEWGKEMGDPKGVQTILKPAIQQLQSEGVNIVARFADRQERFTPHHEMPAYYEGIDLYVCTSQIEGTPNPVLEAMASGVPVISTDVGLVPDLFGPMQQQFILEERTVECLIQSIRKLDGERSLFAQLSQENLRSIEPWDWKLVAPKFGDFIEAMILRHAERYKR